MAKTAITDVANAARGTGFSSATVINLFTQQGNTMVNLDGLDAQGGPAVSLANLSSTELTFAVPAGVVDGPAYLRALSRPFVAFASSGGGSGRRLPSDRAVREP